ncbi:MAG TPA: hypothetical protein VEV38_13235 [Candidatus Eremiobacteraceae bacterium]|nr:hypothetical protein [Candidatus Eremiobacteraceae bacterium]
MDLDRQIAIASRLLYVVAAASIVHCLTTYALPLTWVLGSGMVDVGAAYASSGYLLFKLLGFAFEFTGVVLFLVLAFFVGRRSWFAMLSAMLFLLVDGAFAFKEVAMGGLGAFAPGLLVSFLVVAHVIIGLVVFRAFWAVLQRRTNENIVRQLEFENELRRRLSEFEGPAPPAATFTTRWPPRTPRPMPPQPQG